MASIPKHRKKVKHYDIAGDAHFLTYSCYRRYQLLSKDRTRLWFTDALENARTKHGFHLRAWVIIPEHIHLLLWMPDAEMKTEKILASINKPVSYKACRYLKEHAPQFLERLTVAGANRTYDRRWEMGSSGREPGVRRQRHPTLVSGLDSDFPWLPRRLGRTHLPLQ